MVFKSLGLKHSGSSSKIPVARQTYNSRVWSMVVDYFFGNYLNRMLIKELSVKTGLSPHTIRYYEKYGLIKGRRKTDVKSNNYFHYDEETVEKVQIIRDAKAIGFTLAEISKVLDAWYNNKFSIAKKIAILDEKLRSIDEKMKQLKGMKRMIAKFKWEIEKDEC
jgi:MerR family Zn(II)-responsive transcriptional regulator of zntA